MNVTAMRLLDNTLGVAGCWLLSVVNSVKSLLRRGRPNDGTPPRRVLVIKLLGLGTILLTSTVTRSLKQLLPGVQVDFLTFEQFKPAVELAGHVDELCLVSGRSAWAFVVSAIRILRKLRANRYDLVVDLDYFARFTMILSYLTGAPRRAGFHSPSMYRGNLLTDRMHYSIHLQMIDMFYDGIAKVCGAQPERPIPGVQLSEDDMRRGHEVLSRNGLDETRPIILLNPNVSAFSAPPRRWNKDKFALLAQRCVRELGAQVAITGGPGDVEYVASIVESVDGNGGTVVSLAGQTTLAELAAVSRLVSCMVSCDTGPMILASIAGAPVVVLLGPTAWTHKPVGHRNVVVCRHLPCSPCLTVFNQKHARCVHGSNICMQQIEVDEVFAAVQKVLRGEAHD